MKNMREVLVLSFLLAVALSAILPVRADSTNLAPMFQGGTCTWGDYDIYGDVRYGVGAQITAKDNSVLHDGHSSIRIDAPNDVNKYREVNQDWYAVSPGDHVVMKVWVKCAGSASDGLGAIIGFDCVGDGVRITEAHTRYPQSGIWNYPQTGTAIYTDYGSDWTLMVIDTFIPETYFTHNWNDEHISPTQIDTVGLWVGGSWNGQTVYPSVYFADAEFYINPTLSSTPTPTPTFTAAPTVKPTIHSYFYPTGTPMPSATYPPTFIESWGNIAYSAITNSQVFAFIIIIGILGFSAFTVLKAIKR